MGKTTKCAHEEIEDFEPFFRKDGKLWVPYYSAGRKQTHVLLPEVALKGAGYVFNALGNTGNIVPFILRALGPRSKIADQH